MAFKDTLPNPAIAHRLASGQEEILRGMEDYEALRTTVLFRRIAELTEAKQTIVASAGGRITDTLEVPDYATQRWAIDTALKLRNLFPASRLAVGVVGEVYHTMETLPPLRELGLSPSQLLKLAGLLDGEAIQAEEAIALPALEEEQE